MDKLQEVNAKLEVKKDSLQKEKQEIDFYNSDKRVQYDSIDGAIKAFAEIYSFNIESKLFYQLSKEQQELWRKEIEEAAINGGENGIELANDMRYKENQQEQPKVELEKEIDKEWNKCKPIDEGMGLEIASIEHEQFDNIAKHFFELGMKLKNIQPENVIGIKWKPCTEIPTEHWENNHAISPLYLVKCGSVNGNPILGYAHYSYASNSWMDCFHATERGVWNVLEWTDNKNI